MVKVFFLFFIVLSSSVALGYEQQREMLFNETEEDQDILLKSLLKEQEADHLIEFLAGKNIKAFKKKTTSKQVAMLGDEVWNIYVPLVDAVEAMTALDAASLPNRKKINLFEEYMRRQRELYGNEDEQLSSKIVAEMEKIPGIIDVEVLIRNQPDFKEGGKKMTAIVYVQHDGILDDPHGTLAEKLKKNIYEEIPELDPDDLVFITERKTSKNYNPPTLPSTPKN